jgi:hypothetical protein
MNPIEYRGHIIQPLEGMPGNFEFFMEGGQSIVCGTIQDCKNEIDERIFAETNYPVLLGGQKEVYVWLDDALRVIKYFNAVPLFTFNAP